LGNAVKFTEGGQVIFRVSRVGGQRAEQVPHLIRFEVEDTGPGIPPEQLDTIFEPFQQAGPSKRHTGGSGLGLTICRNLVEAMGSRLQVVSIPEQGSIFWFDVNLPEVAQDAVVSSDPSRKIIGFKGEGSKILVVDDQADNRAMFIDLLSPLGFEIVEAGSGQAGLKKAIEFQPDAIITDLIMPDLDGYELARRLRQTPGLADKIILATSASIFAENQQKCFAAGCDDFIPKPVKASHLFELLHRHLALEWVYADQQPEPDHYDNQVLPVDLILPPPKTLATLQELALVGDIRAIRQRLTHLENSDPRLQPFVETLNPLLKNFQMNKMQELLKQWLEA
jgi:CheY-like chemotaxis protein